MEPDRFVNVSMGNKALCMQRKAAKHTMAVVWRGGSNSFSILSNWLFKSSLESGACWSVCLLWMPACRFIWPHLENGHSPSIVRGSQGWWPKVGKCNLVSLARCFRLWFFDTDRKTKNCCLTHKKSGLLNAILWESFVWDFGGSGVPSFSLISFTVCVS